VRWASCNIFSTQDHAAGRDCKVRRLGFFAWKGESLEDYWWCTYRALSHPDGRGQNLWSTMAATRLCSFTKGTNSRKAVIGETKSTNREEQVIKDLLLEVQRENPFRWHEIVKEWRGVSEETTTGVHRLYKMHQENRLLVPRSTLMIRSPNRNSTTFMAAGIRWLTVKPRARCHDCRESGGSLWLR